MRRRLSEAAGELLETPHKVTDLALAYRFHSPEVFTRAFRRMFGAAPLEYRRAGAADPHARLAPRTLEHLLLAGELGRQPPRRDEWPRRTLAGLMTPIRPAADERRALWAAFRSAWEALDLPATTDFYGVTLYPPGWWQHGAFYLAGAEVPGEAPGLLVTLRLPAGAYVTFGGPHPVERLPRLRELIYQTWLPRLEGRRATLEVECFGERLPEGEIIPERLAIAVC
jgi:AraC family transcriptional regulator